MPLPPGLGSDLAHSLRPPRSIQPELPGLRPTRQMFEKELVLPERAAPPGISDVGGRGRLNDLYQQLEIRLDRAERLLNATPGGPASVMGAGNRAQLEVEVDSITRLLDLLEAEMRQPGRLDPTEIQYLLQPGTMARPDRAVGMLERPDFALDAY